MVVYAPSQTHTAYGVAPLISSGTGQTIAIVDAYNNPNIVGDLTTFDH